MRMVCEDFRQIVADYAAGLLEPADQTRAREHVGACAECARLAAAQQEMWTALSSWDAPPVSPDFDRRLFARLAAEPESWWRRCWRAFQAPMVRRALPVAAAAVTAAVLIIANRPAPKRPVEQQVVIERAGLQADQLEGALEDLETLRELNGIAPAGAAEPAM